jgi:hypothetical protein
LAGKNINFQQVVEDNKENHDLLDEDDDENDKDYEPTTPVDDGNTSESDPLTDSEDVKESGDQEPATPERE